ncbi:PorP/SprF family type IX secretion system membrane protein [Flavicella sediminum]|uniref:PorP/SprF family type IX secretion system membrane protein n=1 Tax=Flavicella sediminum TaxID=2585141 RepID=UPI00111CBBD7|nr:type IX secretion system membrane protein PorP/SprF [Flavicella sediminum]
MRLHFKYIYILPFLFYLTQSFSQETLPVNSDYLSDNVYILHPAAAGVGDSGKIRATSSTQWKGVSNAPSVKTLSFHNRIGNKTGVGVAVYSNSNGNHSTVGLQGTYAYHLNLSRRSYDFEQLSFGLSLNAVQNKFDTSIFSDTESDPVAAAIKASDNYFNGDFGMAYHRNGFAGYFTIKNLFLTTKTASRTESINLRKFLINTSYYFGDENAFQYEPSAMVLYDPYFKRTTLDLNMKFYKNLEQSKLWFALSFRQSFYDSTSENWNYLSPIVGLNHKNLMFAYTYREQLGDSSFVPNGGYHQITIGWNVFVKRSRLAACPNINSSFFH